MTTVRIEELEVYHLPKSTGAIEEAQALTRAHEGAFYLDTCQRWVWIKSISRIEGELPKKVERHVGVEGYEFLLRIATGLESQVVGETEIFGQMKQGWKDFASNRPESGQTFLPLMQRLFEDTKEIRARHVQGFGGASYGSLVRLHLKKNGFEAAPGPLLIVGAGQLATEVAPYFLDQDLWLWNRSADSLLRLEQDLRSRSLKSVPHGYSGTEIELGLWRNAKAIIVCIPSDPERDLERQKAWMAGGSKGRTIVHLGLNDVNAGEWAKLPGFASLDQIFELQRSQSQTRSFQVHQAVKACRERALLRGLGHSISVPHGWEDLAAFA